MSSSSHIGQFESFSKIFIFYFLWWHLLLFLNHCRLLLFILYVYWYHYLLTFLLRQLFRVCLSLLILFLCIWYFGLLLWLLFELCLGLLLYLDFFQLFFSFQLSCITPTLLPTLGYQLLYLNFHICYQLLLNLHFLLKPSLYFLTFFNIITIFFTTSLLLLI